MELSGIKFYDDMRVIKPASRWKDFNKYLMYESDLGTDMESIQKHFASIFQFINYEDLKNTQKEVENLYFNFYNIVEKINGSSVAVAAMVESIQGEKQTDLTEDGLRKISDKISSMLSQEDIIKVRDHIKKKYLNS